MKDGLKTINQIVDIAMSIGKSLDLREMLGISLASYNRNTNSDCSLIYAAKDNNRLGQDDIRLLFSSPISSSEQETIKDIVLESFNNRAAINENSDGYFPIPYDNKYLHIFRLHNTGFLVLLNDLHVFNDSLLDGLREVNNRLDHFTQLCLFNAKTAVNSANYVDDNNSDLVHAIFFVDDGVIVAQNDEAFSLFGYNTKEIIGQEFSKLIVDGQNYNIINSAATKSTNSVAMKTRSGQRLEVQIYSESSVFNGISLFVVNVIYSSNNKLSEADDQINKEIYELVSRSTVDVIFIVNRNGELVFVSESVSSFGYDANKVKGQHYSEFIPENQMSVFSDMLRSVIKSNQINTFEAQISNSEGKLVNVEINGKLVFVSGITHILGSVRDITDRVFSQQVLENKNREISLYHERVDLAMHGSGAGYWDWNISTDEIFFSQKLRADLGYEEFENMDSKSFYLLIHSEDRNSFVSLIESSLDGSREYFKKEHRIRKSDGTYIWVLNTGKFTGSRENGDLRFVGLTVDITERKQYEEIINLERDIVIKLARAKGFEQIVKLSLEFVCENTGLPAAGIYLVDEDNGNIKLISHLGLSNDFVENSSYYAADSKHAELVLRGQPVYSTHNEIIEKENLESKVNLFQSLAIIPISYLGTVIGSLNLASDKTVQFTDLVKHKLEKIAALLGTFIIEARKDEKLNKTRQDYKTLFDTIEDFIFILDMDGKIILVNSTVKKRLGYSERELLTQSVLLVHPPQQHDEAFTNVQEMIQGVREVCLVPLLTKSGKFIPVETKVIAGYWDGKQVLVGVSRDLTERLKLEATIRENAERLEMAIMITNAGLYDWNCYESFVVINERWALMRGYKSLESQVKFETWRNMLHPEDKERVLEQLDLHLKGKIPIYQVEYRTRTKAGNYIWLQDTGKVISHDKDGNPLRLVGTNIEITRTKENELLLQQNLQHQEVLSDIALLLNRPGSFDVLINEVLLRIGNHAGVSRVYIFEDTADGLFCNNTYEWCNDGIAPQMEELQNIPYEIIPSWKDFFDNEGLVFSQDIQELPEDVRVILEPQEVKSIIVFPLYVKGGYFGFIGFDECVRYKVWSKTELELLRSFSGMIANAYERMLSEKSLRENEAKTRAIIDAIPDIIFNFSSDGHIIDFRSNTEEELFSEPADFFGKHVTQIFEEDFSERIVSVIKDCLEKGFVVLNYTLPVSNEIREYEARMVRISENNVMALVRNVSERADYERMILHERDKANQANKAKSEFLANMSHEIRTPMNVILGFSEALFHQVEDPQLKKMVKSILNSGNILLSLLNDILDLSKIEAGQIEINTQPVNLVNLVDEIESMFIEKATEKGLSLSVEYSKSLPEFLLIDEIRLKQILFNLLGNAVKFTSSGYIKVSVLFTFTDSQHGELLIKIEDTGIGIPKNMQSVIFEAFKQASSNSNRKYGGTGLGLTISKRLVEILGGMISFESVESKGSVFTVSIPEVKLAKDILGNKSKINSNLDNVKFVNSTVLVVDDVQTNIESARGLLAVFGINVLTATNRIQTIEVLKNNKPDIILLDIVMEDIDGCDLAEIIINDLGFKNTPIIAYTASVFNSERVLNSGFFKGILLKPVSRKALFDEFSRYLEYITVEVVETAIIDDFVLEKCVVDNLPTIIEELNQKYIPEWNSFKNYFVLYKIEEFTDNLSLYAKKIGFSSLDKYCDKLKLDIESVDLESLKINLEYFPSLVEKLLTYKTVNNGRED